jgi:hypothetical protein
LQEKTEEQKKHRKKNPTLMSRDSLFRFFLALLAILFVLLILVWNIRVRQRCNVEFETYRALVQSSIQLAIDADSISDAQLGIQKLIEAKTKLASASFLVGGFSALSQLAHVNSLQVFNFICTQEAALRKKQSSHPLMNLSVYQDDEEQPIKVDEDV